MGNKQKLELSRVPNFREVKGRKRQKKATEVVRCKMLKLYAQ